MVIPYLSTQFELTYSPPRNTVPFPEVSKSITSFSLHEDEGRKVGRSTGATDDGLMTGALEEDTKGISAVEGNTGPLDDVVVVGADVTAGATEGGATTGTFVDGVNKGDVVVGVMTGTFVSGTNTGERVDGTPLGDAEGGDLTGAEVDGATTGALDDGASPGAALGSTDATLVVK
jgi:hypothetical protein